MHLGPLSGLATWLALTLSPHLPLHLSTPDRVVHRVLSSTPLIDGHVDLPVLLRILYNNDLSSLPSSGYEKLTGNVDLDRIRRGTEGRGGFFSIAYVPCPETPADDADEAEWIKTFLKADQSVRDTLEQIDVTKRLVERYPKDLSQPRSVASLRSSFSSGLSPHLIGIEGAHSLGNSLAVLRQAYELGARYLTLTHTCHNAFADSSGSTEGVQIKPLHGGLSNFGRRLVKEMNRLGMIIDVSHTSDDTARQALELSSAPVIFSHSGSRSVWNHSRNVPDDVLELARDKGALVMIPFVSLFVKGDKNSTIDDVADHIDHIASITGRDHVGIGSDFDGARDFAKGLESVAKYPDLLKLLLSRGWSQKDLKGLVGSNFLRTFSAIERESHRLRRGAGAEADTGVWKEGRPELRREWF